MSSRRAITAMLATVALISSCSGSDAVGAVPSSTTTLTVVPVSTEPPSTTDEPPVDANGNPLEGADDLGGLGDTPVERQSDDESIQIGVGEPPSSLSDDFPLPIDFEAQIVSESDDSLGFTGITMLGLAETIAFYERGLAESGYEITDSNGVDGVFASFGFVGPDGSGEIAISEAPGGVGSTVIVTFG